MDTIKRRCPWCDGLFLLNNGIALCPHCRKPVKANQTTHEITLRMYSEAIAKVAEFWTSELEIWAGEFGEDAVKKLKQSLDKTG